VTCVRSPSKFTSIKLLAALEADHYIGASGKEYSEAETREMLWEKRQAKADCIVAIAVKAMPVKLPTGKLLKGSFFAALDRELMRDQKARE